MKPQIKSVQASKLTLDKKNANRGTARGRALLDKSLQEFGAGRSILVDRHGAVIAGNKTLQQARAAGHKDVLVVQSDGSKLIAVQRTDLDIKDPKARALAIADNRVAELDLEWDADILSELEKEINLAPFFEDDELSELLGEQAEIAEAPQPKLDQAAALEQKWKTKRGQLWVIGSHRLLCGDSTSEEDVVKLTENKKVSLCLTDPPYGVGINFGDYQDTQENLKALISGFFPLAKKFSERILLTPGNRSIYLYPQPDSILCWFTGSGTGANPWGFTWWHAILAYGKDPYLAAGKGSRPDAVSSSEGSDRALDHPTPKPIGVWKWFVERGTIRRGATVLDLFSGSGSSLVACEQSGRICYAMELEPKYVAVALERLSEMGLKPQFLYAPAESKSKRTIRQPSLRK